ncbi:glycerate kinase [Natrialbaceae archaeon A-CW3]
MFHDRATHATTPARETALECLEAGIRATVPERIVPSSVSLEDEVLSIDGSAYDLSGIERLIVVGGGKAATGVVRALESILEPALDDGRIDALEGAVVSRSAGKTSPVQTSHVQVLEGDHPIPSARNREATARVLEHAEDAASSDLVLATITGGASALLTAPAADISVEALQVTTDALLESGASIDEINAVRKHCSAIKGGQLAQAAAPATVVTLAISDVVGDDPSVIGSGPTVADPTTFADALAVCRRYGLEGTIPNTIRRRLESGAKGDLEETPAADDPTVAAGNWHCLAGTRTAIGAAEAVARERGYRTLVLSSRVRGEAADIGSVHAAVAEEMLVHGDPVEPPAVILSGGEVTVTVRERARTVGEETGGTSGSGTGGPNQELALASALEFARVGVDSAVLASIDTDGIDGPTDVCGAIVDGRTLAEPEAANAARSALEAHDVTPFLEERDAVLETGTTGTNVNDLRVVVVDPP